MSLWALTHNQDNQEVVKPVKTPIKLTILKLSGVHQVFKIALEEDKVN